MDVVDLEADEPPAKRPVLLKARPPWRQPVLRGTVDIYTWGKRALEKHPLAESDLDKILRCDVSLDMCHIWDPGAAEGPLRHCSGFNGTICLRLLLMPEFRDRIFESKSVVTHAIDTGVPLRLGVFCNGGRHRSVALAELLRRFLSSHVRVTTTHFTYRNPCGCPGVCIHYGTGRDDPRNADAQAADMLFARVWHHEW